MQGEAKFVGLALQYGNDKTATVFDAYIVPIGTRLFINAPDSAARIAEQDSRIKELEQQLEVARKDADRYRWMRSGGKDLGGEVIIYGYSPQELDESIDAAILQIGGAE